MISEIKIESAKKVTTHNLQGQENGWLLELFKDKETNYKTAVYLSATTPASFKGYHLHRIRAARYVCLKGKMKIITYQFQNNQWLRSEHLLDANHPQRLFIPPGVATGLENIGKEEAWLINYPDPAYDPDLKDEQIEYTEEELKKGIIK